MDDNVNSNGLFLEILVSEIGSAILGSEKIQARFRQISKMGILKDIAHQTVGFNLGDLAKEIIDGSEIKDSFAQPEQEQNENISETDAPSLQAPDIDEPECPDDKDWDQLDIEEDFSENDEFIQQVDGRKLSPNEIRFHKYLEKDFDEEKWLKDAKLQYSVGEDKAA